jgi:moderate conductance mechanosensitive channel
VFLAQDAVEQACGPDRDPWLCRWVGNLTDSKSAADIGKILSPWVSVLLILLGAVIVNRLLRRLVRRAVARWEAASTMTVAGRKVRLIPEPSAPTPTTRRHERAQTIARGLASLASIVVWIIALALILSVFGISGGAVLTSAGLIGVALAFGAQNLLRDLINGGFMIMEDQVGVGDVVDLGVASGTVEDVSLRTTRLRDVEGNVWYVPNGGIPRVGNKSQQWSRVVLDIPVAYGADIDHAHRVISETASALAKEPAWSEKILAPPEVWGVEQFTLETITIRLVVKTEPHEQWRVARELRSRIKLALDAAGIVSTPAMPPTPPPAPGPGETHPSG